MKALLQRVNEASVSVGGNCIGSIGRGLLVFLGIHKEDNLNVGVRIIHRFLNYRIFSDLNGRMNLSVKEIEGGVLLVPQFTLVATTDKGSRPSFSNSMPPLEANSLFIEIYQNLCSIHEPVASGCFGSEMEVALINDGPATFILESH